MIKALPDTGDRLLSEKAKDYVYLMYQMSLAIKNNNNINLSRLAKGLDKKSFC